MDLEIKQLSFSSFSEAKVDILIIALGHESRASYLASKLNLSNVKFKYCIRLVDKVNEKEKERIEKMDFVFIEKSDLSRILSSFYEVIVVDYSVMMKSLYAEILTIFYNSDNLANTRLYFSYTHAIFEKALEKSRFVESIKPILLTDDKLMQDVTKTKLIISLGYERLSAIGIIENLEVSYNDVIILINRESEVSAHYQECLRVNKEFLDLIEPSNIVEINFYNPNQLASVLDSILFRLFHQNYRVIISPMSVKTFSLYAMLCSLKYHNVFFYNVTSINSEPHYQKNPDPTRPAIIYGITKTNLNSRGKIL